LIIYNMKKKLLSSFIPITDLYLYLKHNMHDVQHIAKFKI
jgi:hypothetical protein